MAENWSEGKIVESLGFYTAHCPAHCSYIVVALFTAHYPALCSCIVLSRNPKKNSFLHFQDDILLSKNFAFETFPFIHMMTSSLYQKHYNSNFSDFPLSRNIMPDARSEPIADTIFPPKCATLANVSGEFHVKSTSHFTTINRFV